MSLLGLVTGLRSATRSTGIHDAERPSASILPRSSGNRAISGSIWDRGQAMAGRSAVIVVISATEFPSSETSPRRLSSNRQIFMNASSEPHRGRAYSGCSPDGVKRNPGLSSGPCVVTTVPQALLFIMACCRSLCYSQHASSLQGDSRPDCTGAKVPFSSTAKLARSALRKRLQQTQRFTHARRRAHNNKKGEARMLRIVVHVDIGQLALAAALLLNS